MINLMKFPLLMLCFMIFTGCSKTDTIEQQIQEPTKNQQSSNDSGKTEQPNADYQIIEGKIYRILVDEYLKTNDEMNPDVNSFFREYKVYDGIRDSVYSAIDSISIPKEIDNITEAKKYLQSTYPEW